MVVELIRRIRLRVIFAILVATLALTPALAAHAAGLSTEQIREILQVASEALETNHLPGLSVAVSKDNRVWSTGLGKADLEQDVPVTAQSMFRTASIAKWFTATAAMRLVEDGKLDLDAPIQQYCPQFPKKQWPITARLLLSHMAGVRHNYGDNGEKHDTEAPRSGRLTMALDSDWSSRRTDRKQDWLSPAQRLNTNGARCYGRVRVETRRPFSHGTCR
jgi:CubicO group peptidase (beta-lactamase class C family)